MVKIVETTNTLTPYFFLLHRSISRSCKNLNLMIFIEIGTQQTIEGSVIGGKFVICHAGIKITEQDKGFILFKFSKKF